MSNALSIIRNATIGGKSFNHQTSVTNSTAIVKEVELAAAKSGTLTTRTDDDTGTLTMSGGHGITDGQIVDVYWTGGVRRQMTVGTVATNSVPIDGGDGDVLPSATTAITACVQHVEPFALDGDDVTGLAFFTDSVGTITLTDGTSDYARVFMLTGGSADHWFEGSPDPNPIAGLGVVEAVFTNGSADAATLRVAALYS